MASQNIPSQSCTHLLRILLVMVEVINPKLYTSATDIACDGGGDQGGCDLMLLPRTSQHPWLLDYCNLQSLGAIRPSKLNLCFLCRPASSIQAPPSSFAFVKLLCLRLWTQGWVFWAILVSKTGFVGPNWVPNCVYWVNLVCVNWCSNCFCSANLVCKLVFKLLLLSVQICVLGQTGVQSLNWVFSTFLKIPFLPPKENVTPQKCPPNS
jgi:hypothetical protein